MEEIQRLSVSVSFQRSHMLGLTGIYSAFYVPYRKFVSEQIQRIGAAKIETFKLLIEEDPK